MKTKLSVLMQIGKKVKKCTLEETKGASGSVTCTGERWYYVHEMFDAHVQDRRCRIYKVLPEKLADEGWAALAMWYKEESELVQK